MKKKRIPLMKPYVSQEAVDAVADTLKSGWIGQGRRVKEFEDNFSQYTKADYAVATNTGSAALRLALAVAGVGIGDEVITTPFMWQATNHPVLEQFAVPVFADIKYLSGNIDPDDIEHRITDKTKAIICAHSGGYPCDLDEINTIAAKHDLAVIEEACEAMGAVYKSKPIGSISRFTAFSFYAVQVLNTVEGGMLTLKPKKDYEQAMRRRWFGIDRAGRRPRLDGYYDYDVTEPGFGYPMTDVTASMGLVHLNQLPSLIERRKQIAKTYRSQLKNIPGITLFDDEPDKQSSYQLFTVHVANRDGFCRMMRDTGIDVSVVHVRNDQYTVFGGVRRDLPVLDKFSKTYINLPMHNHLSDEDVGYIFSCISKGW